MGRTNTFVSIIKIIIKFLPLILQILDNSEVQEIVSRLNGEITNENSNNSQTA